MLLTLMTDIYMFFITATILLCKVLYTVVIIIHAYRQKCLIAVILKYYFYYIP